MTYQQNCSTVWEKFIFLTGNNLLKKQEWISGEIVFIRNNFYLSFTRSVYVYENTRMRKIY